MKSPMTKIGDWLAPARDALARVRDAVQAKEREVADLEAERGRLLSLRAPRADLLARLDVEIAALGAVWATGRSVDLVSTLSGAIDVTMEGQVLPDIAYHTNLVNVIGEQLSVPALCWIAPAMMKAGLVRLLDRAAEYDEGAPMATRVARLREVQAEMAVLEEQHQNLVHAAGELGLTIQPLEANRVRAHQARQREERDQERIAEYNRANASLIRQGRVKAAETLEDTR